MFGIGDISIHSLYLSDGAGGWGLILHPMGLTILFALLHFRAQLDIDVWTQSDTPISLRDYREYYGVFLLLPVLVLRA
jgi:hypothetical protein